MSNYDNDKKALRRALMTVRNRIRRIDRSGTWEYPHTGICTCLINVRSYDFDIVGRVLLREGFEAWPKYSGYKRFPVPGNRNTDPGEAYDGAKSKWDVTKPSAKRYARNRRELLDFLIDWLKPAKKGKA